MYTATRKKGTYCFQGSHRDDPYKSIDIYIEGLSTYIGNQKMRSANRQDNRLPEPAISFLS